MSEPMSTGAGKRRPQPEDLDQLLSLIWEGKSLSAACREMGMDIPSTDKWLNADDDRRQQYARACAGRSDVLQEDALTVNRAAALGIKVGERKVDASGAKGYLEAVKFAIGRMAPKTLPPQRIVHAFDSMDDDELDREIARAAARQGMPRDAGE